MNGSWKRIGTILLSSLVCFAAIVCWGSAFIDGFHGVSWFFLVLAVGLTLWFLRMFGRIGLRGVRWLKAVHATRPAEQGLAVPGRTRGDPPDETGGTESVARRTG